MAPYEPTRPPPSADEADAVRRRPPQGRPVRRPGRGGGGGGRDHRARPGVRRLRRPRPAEDHRRAAHRQDRRVGRAELSGTVRSAPTWACRPRRPGAAAFGGAGAGGSPATARRADPSAKLHRAGHRHAHPAGRRRRPGPAEALAARRRRRVQRDPQRRRGLGVRQHSPTRRTTRRAPKAATARRGSDGGRGLPEGVPAHAAGRRRRGAEGGRRHHVRDGRRHRAGRRPGRLQARHQAQAVRHHGRRDQVAVDAKTGRAAEVHAAPRRAAARPSSTRASPRSTSPSPPPPPSTSPRPRAPR